MKFSQTSMQLMINIFNLFVALIWRMQNYNHCIKMKFSIKYFFGICDQICRKPQIWSHLLNKSLMENFIFCAVNPIQIMWQNIRKSNKIRQDQKTSKNSHPEVFLGKGVLNICWKFTGEHYPEVYFQYSCKAFLVKSHFGMAVLL